MANPKGKHTRMRTSKRRAQNWKIGNISSSKCPNCNSLKNPHQVCPSCGFYRDKVVIPVKTKEKKSGESSKK